MPAPRTLDDAVENFIAALNSTEIEAVLQSMPTYRLQPARSFMDRIIVEFQLDIGNQDLSFDINRGFEDEKLFESPAYTDDTGLFEAAMIYAAARARLKIR
jgi:hypothetical protein